ncbi:hypothetical protein [Avibacterium sp. 21-599]|uniref:hypothetical protein n=1 Tax=Avibacterium sp. 21-599 TaxID=2911528 RepID=UPI0022453DB5|nr:hypothetical protein [Avibacterium sp. 21-599]MCW9717368.1 hypothetical protein [Avibacterium sp. 21-599]
MSLFVILSSPQNSTSGFGGLLLQPQPMLNRHANNVLLLVVINQSYAMAML